MVVPRRFGNLYNGSLVCTAASKASRHLVTCLFRKPLHPPHSRVFIYRLFGEKKPYLYNLIFHGQCYVLLRLKNTIMKRGCVVWDASEDIEICRSKSFEDSVTPFPFENYHERMLCSPWRRKTERWHTRNLCTNV